MEGGKTVKSDQSSDIACSSTSSDEKQHILDCSLCFYGLCTLLYKAISLLQGFPVFQRASLENREWPGDEARGTGRGRRERGRSMLGEGRAEGLRQTQTFPSVRVNSSEGIILR